MIKWIFNRGISFKMITFIFLSVSIITTTIFTYIYSVSRNTILDNLKENSKLLTLSTVSEVEKVLTAVQKVPDNLSKIIEEENLSEKQIESMLTSAVANNKEVFGAAIAFEPEYSKKNKTSMFYVYKKDGRTVANYLSETDYDFQIMDWYLIPKQLQRPVWSEPYFDEGGGNIVMSTYSVPLYKKENGTKKIIGMLTADLSLDWLQQLISNIKVYETGYAYMVSRNGSLVTHPKKELIMNATIFSIAEEAKSPQLREIGRQMINGKSSFAEVEYHNIATGKLSWISYAPVKINGWAIGIVYPIDELLAPLNKLFRIVILLAIVGGFILLGVVVFISNSITNPIRKLALATQDRKSVV